jgi:hypothetical protein
LVFGALVFGAITTFFAIRTAIKMRGPPLELRGLALADSGLAFVSTALTLYKFLIDF